ncbi:MULTISPECIES: RNA-binding S4 domain-containing protein [Novosphingobium]|uniref:RNA-binding S4 domain-containing protein n=1 Tax=Novosphingobium TaxID=165696 RepID=UPI001CD69917|nr:RNA-binding S4 domain-containing protein [Novosphingobium percolationis]MCH7627988.1 RNA-binding S4 domain-containing protein [Pseudomonadota bacterium]
MRLDKLLWYLRLAPTRTHAHDWALEGHMRLNGRRIERPSATVRTGDLLVLPTHHGVRVIEVLALPVRRGPAPEAQACYRLIEPSARPDVAPTGATHA